ncbi:MAG: hypothetical protein ACREH8_19210, partial [Opitutaceae bacterium]
MAGFLSGGTPIQQHPQNPHYFVWRGKPVALVTSAAMYGAIINPDFDYRTYLATLAADGMNYTEFFAGAYVHPPGGKIERDTMAPAHGRFLAPWARSDQPGYAQGGNKFDLSRWSLDYMTRLKDILAEADRRGIVVELTFFCSTYRDSTWAVHPLNPANNIQALPVPAGWKSLHRPDNGGAVQAVQERLVRWLVRELNGFDNLFYQIQNEPWSDNHVIGTDYINPYYVDRKFPNAVEITTAESLAWQAAIARVVMDEESRLPKRHMLAQNVANFRLALRPDDIVPGVDLVHFHYAYPETVTWNTWLGKTIGFDETGFAGTADAPYRRQAWNFMMAGGGVFNHLDFSFAVGFEDGTDSQPTTPGGGSPALRRNIRVLSEFLHSFDLASLRPDPHVVKENPGVVPRALSVPGKAYAVYLEGRSPADLGLDLPAGRWKAEWIDPIDGRLAKTEDIDHGGGLKRLTSPQFAESVALRVRRK